MLNRSASLGMSTSVLKALPGKLDIKRREHGILYFSSILSEIIPNKKSNQEQSCSFVSMLYAPVNTFSIMLLKFSCVELVHST